MAAAWTAGPIAAVEEWLRLLPGSARPGPLTRCGEAAPSDDGLLRLDLRDRPDLADLLEPPLVLAGREGPEKSTAFPVERFHLDDGVLVLAEPDGVPPGSRWVWSPVATSRSTVQALLEGLRGIGRAPLAEALAAGRLDGTPTWSDAPPSELSQAQGQAYRACRSPGLRVVWSPPGTGRTRVLARAAEDLVRAGKRVLLVSTAAVAVDAVLLAVVASMRPGRGQVVRVGVPHRPGLDDLGLDGLAARASADVDARRALIARRLTDLAGTDDEITELAARLDGYDPEGYRAAAARVAAAGRREELRTRYQDTLHAAELAYGRVVTARREHDRLVAEAAALADARAAMARLPELQAELRELDAREEGLRAELRAAGRSRRRAKQAEDELTAFGPTAVARRRELWDEIIATRRAIGSTTPEQLGRLDGATARTERAATAAWLAFEPVESELRRLERAMEQANEVGPPTDADHALVERSERERLPALHERWTRLRAIRAQSAGDRSAHEEEHRRLAERSGSLRTDAEAEIVAAASLVGTTLARSLTAPVAGAGFDVVLVDGAEAATLAEVLLALAGAGETAVLVGDFGLPGPDLPDAVVAAGHPALRTWVLTGGFGHVGISTPEDALAHDGCVALQEPWHGGAAVRRLVNDLGYRVLREPADAQDTDDEDPAATEIVVVDVAALPDLAAVRRGPSGGPWWTAGAVLAPALARGAAPEVGVLTTSRAQVGPTLAALRDRDLLVGCGPVAAFRGRALDTVVLDQVEDEPDVRAFALGVTRARRRLFVLVDGPALDATTGPLAALRHAVDRGDARSWSAAALLGLDGPAPYRSDRVLAEVGDPLRRAVAAVDVSDEADLRAALDARLGEARDSLWLWSPWPAAGVLAPLVAAAVGRGVRVRAFVRPDEDGDGAAALRESGATVVRAEDGPRRLAVVDRRTVVLGSAVLAAGPRGPREALLAVEGRALAERLLVDLAADALGDPRPCATCADPMEVSGEGADTRWECRSCGVESNAGRAG
ncbi:AAA domain-containing protein [Pseudonocardia lacus]|uniref:AAA domain-containing protein n=1 Tax=Pseudonocardia lacus TaxID=2835865 RepID=UPI001BDC2F7A|nr:AAA domain-containing protein [Pseudonocardia lacus]